MPTYVAKPGLAKVARTTVTVGARDVSGSSAPTTGQLWPRGGGSGSGGAPSGAAGGDLTGTYPNPTVKDTLGGKTFTGATYLNGAVRLGEVGSTAASVGLSVTDKPVQVFDATAGQVTVTLPTTTNDGIIFILRKADASANYVLISAGSIDGPSIYALENQYDTVILKSTTTADTWRVLNAYGPAAPGGLMQTIPDWNTATLPGWYYGNSTAANSPRPGAYYIGLVVRNPVATWAVQHLWRIGTGDLYEEWVRQWSQVNGWRPWYEIGGVPVPSSVASSGSTDPFFKNGWQNYGTPYADASFWKDGSGVVHLQGLVRAGTISTTATGVIFRLPAGYAPAVSVTFPGLCGGPQPCRTQIANTGDVYAYQAIGGGTNGFWTLDGISFLAA